MNLSEFQIEAIVNTLEKEHNKFWKEKDKLTEKAPVEKKDKYGLTKKEKEYLVDKNKAIRKELAGLSFQTRLELQYTGSDFFANYWRGEEKGNLDTESNTLRTLIENYNAGKETRKEKNADKPKKESGRIFNRADVTRKVTLASIECESINDILAKVRKRDNNKHIIEKARKAVPKKKLAKKK